MDVLHIVTTLSTVPFREAVWLFPAATALHFLEEAPSFAKWAQAHASPLYTSSRWRKIHAIGLAYAIAFTMVLALFPNRYVTLLSFASLRFSSILCFIWVPRCSSDRTARVSLRPCRCIPHFSGT